jgi:hypothetical protein
MITLAQDRLSRISSAFESTEPDSSLLMITVVVLTIVVGVPIAIAVIIRLRRRYREPDACAWRALARDVGLARRDERLLRRMARSADVSPAAAILLSEGVFDAAAAASSAEDRPKRMAPSRLSTLRAILFSADHAEEAAPSASSA